ncbi:MAG: PLP-dependent aminotransferase family protein [Bacilli bacterium]|nr:PLP-dependent aminotransferase family protein [Bacilli bacterium]
MATLSSRMAKMADTSYVCKELFEYITDPEVIKLNIGSPASEVIPIDIIREITNDVITKEKRGLEALGYGPILGVESLRQTIVKDLLRPKGVEVSPDNIIITTGGIEGINMAMQICTNKGDTVLVEAPTFIQAAQIFDMFEVNMVSVDMDEDGMRVDDLEKKIIEHNPKVIYVIPTFQNPSGRTLILERRKKVAELASKYDIFVIEDDPYRDIRFTGEDLAPIKAFDKTGHVILCNSFSKIFTPGVRLGYTVASDEIIKHLWNVKMATNSHTSMFPQVICDEFFKRGYYPEHHKMICDIYRERCQAICDGIDTYFPKGSKRTNPEGGLFIWVELPEGIDTAEVQLEAKTRADVKVVYVTGEKSFIYSENDKPITNTLRLAFGASSPEKIMEGCRRLGTFFKEKLNQE